MALFESGSHKSNIGAAYQVLGPEKSNVLLGFHTFTMIRQASSTGKSKATCWKVFLGKSEVVLAAFAYSFRF